MPGKLPEPDTVIVTFDPVIAPLAVPFTVIDPRHVSENVPDADVAVCAATFQVKFEQLFGSGSASLTSDVTADVHVPINAAFDPLLAVPASVLLGAMALLPRVNSQPMLEARASRPTRPIDRKRVRMELPRSFSCHIRGVGSESCAGNSRHFRARPAPW